MLNCSWDMKNNRFGIKYYDNNSKIIGFFNEENEINGIATYISIDSNHKEICYSGLFDKNYLNGFGYSRGFSDCCYIGEWVESKQENYGIEVWSNGSFYKGQFKDGKRNGIGSYFWSDGGSYNGEWEKKKMDGNVSLCNIIQL